MSEFRYIQSLYEKQKKYPLRLVLLSALAIIVASIISSLDLIRISPFLIFMVAMALVLFYSRRLQTTSKNFSLLKDYLEEYDPDVLENRELVFFIDYQLKNYFGGESDQLFKALKDENPANDARATAHLQEVITEIKEYYNYLLDHSELENDLKISLAWYRETIDTRKQDLL
ncbi:hypothetical protein [Enterococcus canis]|nr:hypothetical protein [Enterococcus canis]